MPSFLPRGLPHCGRSTAAKLVHPAVLVGQVEGAIEVRALLDGMEVCHRKTAASVATMATRRLLQRCAFQRTCGVAKTLNELLLCAVRLLWLRKCPVSSDTMAWSTSANVESGRSSVVGSGGRFPLRATFILLGRLFLLLRQCHPCLPVLARIRGPTGSPAIPLGRCWRGLSRSAEAVCL